MKRPRVQPLGLGEEHRSKKYARSTTITATYKASRARWDLIIAAIRLVFVSIRWRFMATEARPRACGGPAIMIMHPVNSGVGIHVIGGIGGVPGITETEDASRREPRRRCPEPVPGLQPPSRALCGPFCKRHEQSIGKVDLASLPFWKILR